MYTIAENHEDISHPHTIKILNNFQGYTRKSLQKLVDKNFVTLHGNMWRLTQKGYESAANLYNQQTTDDE